MHNVRILIVKKIIRLVQQIKNSKLKRRDRAHKVCDEPVPDACIHDPDHSS